MNRSALEDLRARMPEWRAALAWIVGSWCRPAGAEASGQQGGGRAAPPVRGAGNAP